MPFLPRMFRTTVRLVQACVVLLALLATLPAGAEQRVRVGVYENNPKVAMGVSGQPEGIFVDIIEAIAAQEGWTLEYVPGSWQEGLDRLAAGRIDLMPDVAYTAERARLYAFNREPVLSSWSQVYARRGSGIRALPDLNGRRVAVLEGSSQEEQFRNMVAGFGLSVELLPQPDFASAFRAVAAGRADTVLTNRFYGVRHAAAAGLEDTAIIFSPTQLHFAAPKNGNPALLIAIDRNLRTLKQNPASIYYHSLRHWASGEENTLLPSWLLWTVAAVLALLLMAGAWAALLRRQVNARTTQLRRHGEEMAAINRILRATSSSLRLDTVFDEAAKDVLELTGCDGGVLCVRDPQQGLMRVGARLHSCATTDHAPDGGPLRDTVCPAMLEGVAKGRRPLVQAASATGTTTPCANVRDPSVRWNVYFPLEAHDHVIGVLCLFSRKDEPPRQRSLDLVQELCAPLALAMENARLYEETRLHSQELEARVAARTAELAETTHFLDALVDHIPSPIFYKGADLRFRGCNRAYEQAFGVTRENFIGKTVLDLEYLPPSDREAYQAEDTAMVTASRTLSREAMIPFADGRTHHTLYSVSGFRRPDGSPGGLVGIIVDITPLKEAEAALAEAKHTAEAADRLKSAFLATMSHELRTPLNSIIGFTGIILQELAGPLNEEQKKQLGMVQNSARHLLALINDVLDISKIEAGELAVARERYDLGASIAKVVDIVRPLAERKGLALTVEVAGNVGEMVGDARRVEQILLNLIGNAIKFTESGTVSLFAHMADTASGIGKKVCLRVADTGIGIKEEDMALLFQPFRQVDSALTRQHEGTGLGLAICRRLAALMDGTITAESRWGEGSAFTITLPRNQEVAGESK